MDYATEQAKIDEKKAWQASGLSELLDKIRPDAKISELMRRTFSMGYFAGRIKFSLENRPTAIEANFEEN